MTAVSNNYNVSDFLLTFAIIAVALFFAFGLRPILAARKAKRVVVDELFTGLLVQKGRVTRVLEPGVYSTWMTDDRIELYDTRAQSFQVAGQEMLTRDLQTVRLTMVVRHRIADAKLYRSAHTQPLTRLYEDVQLEMRRRVAAITLDELLADRNKIAEGFTEALIPAGKSVGVEMMAVELRDLTLAGAAKQAFADIWKAQKEGQASMERARNEQASLRSLANAARMLKGNPELMNLRLLQALSGGPGKSAPTIVLGGGAGLLPVSANVDPGADAES